MNFKNLIIELYIQYVFNIHIKFLLNQMLFSLQTILERKYSNFLYIFLLYVNFENLTVKL